MKLPDMNMNGIPIIGQAAYVIPAQLRLDAAELVGKVLDEQKKLGLRFGRVGVGTEPSMPSAQYLLLLEHLEAAGCRIVGIAEHPATGAGGQTMVIACIIFRAPESLFVPSA